MEVIRSQEGFKFIDGKYRFSYVHGFVRYEGAVYVAKWHNRKEPPHSFSELSEVRRLNMEDRGPELQPHWIVAAADLQDCYVKTPSLLAYADEDIETLLRREIETCEILRQHPHRHIALYYGCQATRGRAIGLCSKRYVSTLADKVDPEHLNKAAFVLSGRPNVVDWTRQALWGIKQAIYHLHSLGIIHNDISPANIMLEEDGTMVLIDFDSCRYVGEELCGRDGGRVKRTRGWHDPDVTVALKENDIGAYKELEAWLFGESSNQFIFK